MFQPILKQIFTLALAGALIILPIANAEALTEAQVIERLSGIPVFTITDDKGSPLLGTKKATEKGTEKGSETNQVLLFFLNPIEANTMLKQVQTANPDLGKKAKVIVRTMNDAYKIIQGNKDKKIEFQIVPSRSSLESARTILTVGGKPPEQLPNIPVFFAVDAKKGNEDALLTLEQQGKQLVPFFFEQNDLQSLIENAKKGQPNITNETKIQVVSLVQVLDSMVARENNKPSPDVEKFTFIPSRIAYDWILKNQPQSGQPTPKPPAVKPSDKSTTPTAKPTAKPAPTTSTPAPKPTAKPAPTTSTPAPKPTAKPSEKPAKPVQSAPATKQLVPAVPAESPSVQDSNPGQNTLQK